MKKILFASLLSVMCCCANSTPFHCFHIDNNTTKRFYNIGMLGLAGTNIQKGIPDNFHGVICFPDKTDDLIIDMFIHSTVAYYHPADVYAEIPGSSFFNCVSSAWAETP